MTIEPNHPNYLRSVYDSGGWEESDMIAFCDAKVDGGFVCTRKLCHDGDHAAHTGPGLQVFRWPREEA